MLPLTEMIELCTERRWFLPCGVIAGTLAIGYAGCKVYRSRARVPLTGKAVLITGCDTGFGHALALRLHESVTTTDGLRVYAGCLDASGPGAKALEGREGIVVLQMSVTDPEQVRKAVEVVREDKTHALHAVVNNAGLGSFGEVELLPLDIYRKFLEVNFLGAVSVTQHCLPGLRASAGSRVVNVTSLAGKTALYNLSAYCASKFALDAFSSALRQEMKKWGVHVAVIEPGPYETSIGVGNLDAYINKLWDAASPEVQQDYGREFFDAYQHSGFYSSPHVEELVDALENAVLAKYPRKCYRRGPGSVVIPWLTWFWPAVYDWTPLCIMSRYTFYTGAVPKALQT